MTPTLREYTDYNRDFLHRNGPNNGVKPLSWYAWLDWLGEEIEQDGRDWERSVSIDNAQRNFV